MTALLPAPIPPMPAGLNITEEDWARVVTIKRQVEAEKEQERLNPSVVAEFRDCGAAPEDLDLLTSVLTEREVLAEHQHLLKAFASQARSGKDTSTADLLAWAVVIVGERLPVESAVLAMQAWDMLGLKHGWLFHAAGLTATEASTMTDRDVPRLLAIAALRGHRLPKPHGAGRTGIDWDAVHSTVARQRW